MSSMKLKFSVYIFLLKSDCRYDLYLLTAGTESERGLATRQEGKQSTSVLASVLFKKCESFLTMLEWCFSNNSARLPQSFPEKYSRTPVKIFSWWLLATHAQTYTEQQCPKQAIEHPSSLRQTHARKHTNIPLTSPSETFLRNLSQKCLTIFLEGHLLPSLDTFAPVPQTSLAPSIYAEVSPLTFLPKVTCSLPPKSISP